LEFIAEQDVQNQIISCFDQLPNIMTAGTVQDNILLFHACYIPYTQLMDIGS
jgi:hypothetical protein